MECHRILLASADQQGVTQVLVAALAARYEVVEAVDGGDAFAKLEACEPDLAILDADLKFIDGFQLCQTIRSHPDYRKIPIFIISRVTSRQEFERGYKLGANVVVAKPVDAVRLIRNIDFTIQREKVAVRLKHYSIEVMRQQGINATAKVNNRMARPRPAGAPSDSQVRRAAGSGPGATVHPSGTGYRSTPPSAPPSLSSLRPSAFQMPPPASSPPSSPDFECTLIMKQPPASGEADRNSGLQGGFKPDSPAPGSPFAPMSPASPGSGLPASGQIAPKEPEKEAPIRRKPIKPLNLADIITNLKQPSPSPTGESAPEGGEVSAVADPHAGGGEGSSSSPSILTSSGAYTTASPAGSKSPNAQAAGELDRILGNIMNRKKDADAAPAAASQPENESTGGSQADPAPAGGDGDKRERRASSFLNDTVSDVLSESDTNPGAIDAPPAEPSRATHSTAETPASDIGIDGMLEPLKSVGDFVPVDLSSGASGLATVSESVFTPELETPSGTQTDSDSDGPSPEPPGDGQAPDADLNWDGLLTRKRRPAAPVAADEDAVADESGIGAGGA